VIPLPLGAHEVCVTAINVGPGSDVSLGCRTATVVDLTAPAFTGAPMVDVRRGTVSSSGLVPVSTRWSVTDEVGVSAVRLTSPVAAAYDATTTTAEHQISAGTATWTVAADDAAGNTGVTSASRTLALVPEQSAVLGNYWWRVDGSYLLGGSGLRTNRAGASMSHTFVGRSVGWVASRESTSGRAHIYVDGVREATVDLRSMARSHREVVFARSWAESGSHTIKVVADGTSGRRTVTSDGFITVG
jgi:hypothetical protein